MATIVNNKQNYGEGHSVVFTSAIKTQKTIQEILALKIKLEQDVFQITLKNYKPDMELDLGNGRDSIQLLDKKKKVLLVKGKADTINKLFKHYSANAKGTKANTNLLTEIKELYSMEVFRAFTNSRQTLKEDEVIKLVQAQQRETKNNLDDVFYTSAIKQLEVFKTLQLKGQFDFERQGGPRTKELYKHARALTGKSNDNWNPADVWIINRKCDMSYLLDTRSPTELNTKLAEKVKKKEIIPVSLKQVEGPKARLELVDPASAFKENLDMNFTLDRIDLSGKDKDGQYFKNCIIYTRSGYATRVAFKASSTTLNVSLEGRFVGEKAQIGGIDAKEYRLKVKRDFNYDLRGSSVNPGMRKIADAELKEMFGKYGRLSNTIKNFAEVEKILNDKNTMQLTKDRYVNMVSYMYSILIIPNSQKKFEEHMKFQYLTAKKLSEDSSLYYLIK
tara:strand:- start:464 stop:1804 length:1341 start_codon:yes stop_codon:yes gene_type:complete